MLRNLRAEGGERQKQQHDMHAKNRRYRRGGVCELPVGVLRSDNGPVRTMFTNRCVRTSTCKRTGTQPFAAPHHLSFDTGQA